MRVTPEDKGNRDESRGKEDYEDDSRHGKWGTAVRESPNSLTAVAGLC